MFFGIVLHGAEFVNIENFAVFANARLNVDDFMEIASEKIGNTNNNVKWDQKDTAN